MKNLKGLAGALMAISLVFSSFSPTALLAIGSGVSTLGSGVTSIVDLKVESTIAPIGIDVIKPRFSWKMESEVTGQLQTKYQVIVATTEASLAADNGDVWDSGVVVSSQSNNVEYAGIALKSMQRYFWKVYVFDKDGTKLTADNSYFEMGLLDKALWNGQFISTNELTAQDVPAYSIEVDFRIDHASAGIIFGGKSGNFLMWQINIIDHANTQQVYFRPHHWNPGATCLAEKDISTVIPWDKRNDKHTMRIEVTSDNLITTYIDGSQIDQRTDAGAGFGQFGFRESPAPDVLESMFCSKFVVKKSDGGVLFQDSITSGQNPFAIGTLTKNATTGINEVLVGPISGDTYMQGTAGSGASMFRKEFTTTEGKTIKSARLYASALGVYDAYINGSRVTDAALSPGWTDYDKYIMYQTYDITSMLDASGKNAVGAIVGNGWYSGHVSQGRNAYGVDVAFIGQIVVTYSDGTTQIIGTDNTWKATKKGPYIATDNEDGETYDARQEMPGWAAADFDSSAWVGSKIALKTTINTKLDVANLNFVAQIGPLVMPQDELPAITITNPTQGTYIANIGQNIAGWVKLTIRGGKAGDKIKIRYGEMLYDDRAGALNGTLYTANLRGAAATDYYTKKGDGVEVYEPRFTFHGFQYIEVTGYTGELKAEDISGIFVGSNTEAVGNYQTSNTMINKLFSNLTWSQRDNFLSIPTDCPQRDERLGWSGDAQVFARTATYNMDLDQFYKKYLTDIKSSQLANGAIYDTAPSGAQDNLGSSNAGWGDVAVILPWTMYLTYGDKQVLLDNYSVMTKMLDYLQTVPTTAEPYIIQNGGYGDWVAVESTNGGLIATAYFAYSTNLLAKIAGVLGNTADADKYNQLFIKIRQAFNDKYVTAATGRLLGNTQTSYLLALKMDLLPTQALRDMAGANLAERIAAANNHLTTGFLGINLLCPVLTESGNADLAYKLLLNDTYPSWGYEIANGATTIWERWNSFSKEEDLSGFGFNTTAMNSFNHYSYGSIGEWMYRYSAGIEADENSPAYKKIKFQPTVGGELTFVNGSYNSIYGKIESNWTHVGSAFNYNIKVPANTTGTVNLPTDSLSGIKINGASYTPGSTNVEGVTYVEHKNGNAVFTVQSGRYTFSSNVTQVIKRDIKVESSDSSVLSNALISVNDAAEEMHSLPFTGSYVDGTNLKIRVVPINDVDYSFSKWEGDATGTTPIEVTVDKNVSYIADFSFKGIASLAIGKTISATNSYESSPSWSVNNLIDGKLAADKKAGVTGFTTNGTNTQALTGSNVCTITIDLGAAKALNEIRLYPRTDSKASNNLAAGFPTDFKIEASSNASFTSPTLITSQTNFANPGFRPAIFSTTELNARYVRLTVTKTGDMATDDVYYRVQLSELGIYDNQILDFSALDTSIQTAQALISTSYTPTSWSSLQQALDSANQVKDSISNSQSTINSACQQLLAAIDGLKTKANITALTLAIAQAQLIETTLDTPLTVGLFTQALAQAITISTNLNATQNDVNQSLTTLTSTINGLTIRANITALNLAITQAQQINTTLYTTSTVALFNQALEQSKVITANLNSSQDTVDQARNSLLSAINSLSVIVIDKATLQTALSNANSIFTTIDNYAPETAIGLSDVIAHTQAMLDKADATQVELDTATNNLKSAISLLRLKAIKLALTNQVSAASQLDMTKYTVETSNQFKIILAQSLNMLNNPNATQEQVDQAVKMINDATNSLVVITTKSGTGKNPDTGNSNWIFTLFSILALSGLGCIAMKKIALHK